MEETVQAFEWSRMLLGDEPPLFLLEIAFRTIVIYSYTLVLIRWIGSRSIAQLSLVEFLLVIALGSAVGDAMFYPDVPLLQAMLVITIVVLLDKTLSFIVARSPRLEDAIEGKSVEIVREGTIDCAVLRNLNFGHDELFEQLRLKDFSNLAQVRAAYVETNGMVSAFRRKVDADTLGLSIDPPWDVQPPVIIKAGEELQTAARLACSRCGTVLNSELKSAPACEHCGSEKWHRAKVAEPE